VNDNELFSNWLRTARTQAGLSQQKVADAMTAQGLGFFQTTVAKIEQGQRPLRLDEAAALTRLFGTTIDAALGLKPDDPGSIAASQLAVRTSLLWQIRAAINAELGGEA
jgi:transcriptional regulator with XRE-family HTH domain